MTDEIEIDEFTPEQLRLLRAELLPADTSDGEFDLFVQQCYRTRLDPFARQIQGTPGRAKQKDGTWGFKLTIVVTIDGFRAIADRSGLYAGQTEPEWCGDDGEWKTVWLADGPPAAARCGVYRAGSDHAIYAVMTWRESPGPGSNSPVWKKMQAHMLHKCAEALALRKAFPNQLGGLYTNDEMGATPEAPAPAVPVEVRELAATPDPDAADYPRAATVDPGPPVLEEQQLDALVAVFDRIGDGAAKIATKQEFVGRWGPPAQLAASSYGEALLWAEEKAALWQPPAPEGDDGGMEVGPLPESYKKADLMRFRPDHLDEEEFMELVLEKARELTPNSQPADVVRSWRGLQGRPALVRTIVDIVEDGLLEEPAPEPFE